MEATQQIPCPDCTRAIQIAETAEVGEIVECSNCGAEAEIISKNPLQLDLLEEEK